MAQSMINIKIHLFASIKERIGKNEFNYKIKQGSSVCQLLQNMGKEFKFHNISNCMVAIDMEYVHEDYIIEDNDKIFLIPPVSGGSGESDLLDDKIIIQENEINKEDLISSLFTKEDGAVLIFNGVTRNKHDNKKVLLLEYESFVPMAMKEIRKIFSEIHTKWDISKIVVYHRLGKIFPGDTSMLVAISSKNRKPAIEAIDYFIDHLKKVVPIWKKEIYEDGEEWVEENIV